MNVFDSALAELRMRGWTKETYENSYGNVCAMGAIRIALGDRMWEKTYDPIKDTQALVKIIKEQWPERYQDIYATLTYEANFYTGSLRSQFSGVLIVTRFNDHDDTVQSDIELLLEKAAAEK